MIGWDWIILDRIEWNMIRIGWDGKRIGQEWIGCDRMR